jgi:ribosomal protein L37E
MARVDYTTQNYCRADKIRYPKTQKYCEVCGYQLAVKPRRSKEAELRAQEIAKKRPKWL